MINVQPQATDVAIIGMSALFPGASDLKTYWQNIINRVSGIKDAPDAWVRNYFDPDSKENDRIYNKKGGFIGDIAEFNPLEFGIMPNSVDGGEPVHFLALKLARDAFADAGYLDRPFNRDKTGVILGRGTYVNRAYNSLMQHGLVVDQTLDIIRQLLPQLTDSTISQIRQNLKQSLPPFTAEMAPGLSPNVLTGRIANRFDLKGPNYIVDGACASGLIALELGISELQSGRCDLVLTGGAQASTPPQIQMIFCQLGALSRSQIQPFGQMADGTLLSEGLGMLLLKRLADAERDGDRIYAVVKGVGTSSDGKALGLLAPRPEGEILALQRAYEKSGIAPESIGLIEAHGTGIPLGDRTEIHSLTQVFGSRQHLPHCALGSVKSMIGHCLPAAGAASLIKTVLALYHKVLPPTLCEQVNSDLEIEQTPFYLNTEARPWIQGNGQRRAGVNAFGFGGVNGHAVLEEYQHQTPTPPNLHSQWPTELLVLVADNRQGLIEKNKQVQQAIETQPQIPLAGLVRTLNSQQDKSQYRLAVVAKDLPELQRKLTQTLEKLTSASESSFQTRNGIYYATRGNLAEGERIAFLFPGEGSQYPNMLADISLHFPVVRSWFDFLDQTFAPYRDIPPSHFIFPPPTSLTKSEQQMAQDKLFQMDLASETVFTTNLAMHELLKRLGVKATVMVGHSTGENSALIASGTVRLNSRHPLGENMRYLNQIYRALVAADRIPKGVLLSVGAIDKSVLDNLVTKYQGRLYLAISNCPNQTILFGDEEIIQDVQEQLQQLGAICTRLPFDRAYHTSRFAPISSAFRAFYNRLEVGPGETTLYSCAIADKFPDAPEEIRELATRQWSAQVRFSDTIEACYEKGIRTFVEVGPNRNLTGFVRDILRDRPHLAQASNIQNQSGLTQLHHLLANLWVQGADLNLDYLYRNREVATINLDSSGVADPPSPKKKLDLTMPILRLEPELIQQIHVELQEKPSSVLTTEPSQTLPPEAEDSFNLGNNKIEPSGHPGNFNGYEHLESLTTVGVELRDSASHSTSQEQISPQMSELTLMHSHFDLMQTFLEQQHRIATEVFCDRSEEQITPWPLLGQVVECTDQYFYSERVFDLNYDQFLQDHTLGNQLSVQNPELLPLAIVPFTISLEIIAEAAVYLTDSELIVTAIEDVKGYQWITLDRGQVHLGIEAKLQSDPSSVSSQQVDVKLFQLENNPESDHKLVFEGRVILAANYPPSQPSLVGELSILNPSRWSDRELYTTGMFHGPSFQGVKHLRGWNQESTEAELRVISTRDFFHSCPQVQFQVDAGLLDAAGQLVAYWISEQSDMDFHAFPFQVKAFRFLSTPLPPETTVICRGKISFVHDRQLSANFEIWTLSGEMIAQIEGWDDVFLKVPRRFFECRMFPQTASLSHPWMLIEEMSLRRIDPFPSGFLENSGGLLQRVLAHLVLNSAERNFWYDLPSKSPRRLNWLMGRIVAKDCIRQWAEEQCQLKLAPVDITILPTATGKPQVICPVLSAIVEIPDLSISHSEGWAVAAIAPLKQQIGLDVQPLKAVNPEDIILLAFSVAERQLLPKLTSNEVVGLWSVKEAASKAIGVQLHQPHDWQITDYFPETGKVKLMYGDCRLNINLIFTPEEAITICYTKSG